MLVLFKNNTVIVAISISLPIVNIVGLLIVKSSYC